MSGVVACTIKSRSTDIFCVVMICLKNRDGAPPSNWWKRIYGHLFDDCVIGGDCRYGDAGHWTNGSGKLALVGEVPGFAVPYSPVPPIIQPDYVEPLTVAELFEVPADFPDSVTPQNTITGEGKLILTQETLEWSIWKGAA